MIKDLCFEIIEQCPNNCLFCSSNSNINKTRMIDLATFKKVIAFLVKKYGIEEISLSGGEPFLHPDLFEMIEYCKSSHIRTFLFTSGILKKKIFEEDVTKEIENIKQKYDNYLEQGMPKEEYDKYIQREIKRINEINNQQFSAISRMEMAYLKNIGLDKIVFDFQAWNPETYNRIMGTKNFWEYVTTSMVRAHAARLETDAHFIPTKINYQELPEIIEMLNYIHFNTLSILNFVPQGRGEINSEQLQLNEDEFRQFVAIYEQEKTKFEGHIRIGIPLNGTEQHKCTAGLEKLVIKYDGTVLPCPAFKEFDPEILRKNGFKTLSIYGDLEEIKIFEGTRSEPLCKKLYKFNQVMK